MINHSLFIRLIAKKDVPAVLRILAMQFGEGYVSGADVEKYFKDSNHCGWVAEYNQDIVGITLASTFPLSEIKQHVYLNAEQVQAIFPNQKQIGMAKLMAILPNYTGRGIGLELMTERMRWFEHNCEAVISVCWEESNGAAAKLLTKRGFQKRITIPDYWKEESLRTPYDCARCGAPPCRCSGSLYVKCFD